MTRLTQRPIASGTGMKTVQAQADYLRRLQGMGRIPFKSM